MAEIDRERMVEFVRESNKIEGILREPTEEEVDAHIVFVNKDEVHIQDLIEFVNVVQPGAVLRDKPGLDVRVGSHVAPPGGPHISSYLYSTLSLALSSPQEPHLVHCTYETLHPFTDGNGRSGRVLWLWMMSRAGQLDRALTLGFLHSWYYQSLEEGRES